MSHDEHGHEKDPIIPTSGRRMGKGMLIIVITLAIGAAILLPSFNLMYANPPPVTQIRTESPPTEQPPAEAGTTTISMLQGAATQGAPDFDPDAAQVPLGNKVVWQNHDTVPHTATSGADDKDPDKGKLFDTSIVMAGEKSAAVELAGAKEGDAINYFCSVHPYMRATITITAAGEGNATGASGPSINILQGAAVQGSADYDPDPLTAKKGDSVSVANQDNVPHSLTSGTGSGDADKGKLFDTNIIMAGESATISLAEVDPGTYDYFCIVHEYMKGVLTVE